MIKILFLFSLLMVQPLLSRELEDSEKKEVFRLLYSDDAYLTPFQSYEQSEHIAFIRNQLPSIKREAATLSSNSLAPITAPLWQPSPEESHAETAFFEHGGGLIHILKFLKGESEGYPLEGVPLQRRGIQVSPFISKLNQSARADHYAVRLLDKYFDYPAVLVGSIDRKFLEAQPNSYEAGIRTENFDKIKVLIFQPLALRRIDFYHYYRNMPNITNFLDDIEQGIITLPKTLLNLYNNDRIELIRHWSKVSTPYGEDNEEYKHIKSNIEHHLLKQD